MNRREYLLTCLAEECAEVAQRATKALRFGLTEKQPGDDRDNATRLQMEFADLLAVNFMMIEEGIIPTYKDSWVYKKKAQTEEYMGYSRSCGTLQD